MNGKDWEGIMTPEEQLTALEDRVARISFQQHQHTDHPDGYATAYVEGYQDAFIQVRGQIEALLRTMGNQPIPNGKI